jgi:hypothetical protein
MSVDELDRIASGMPAWEGMPAPAAGELQARVLDVARLEEELLACRSRLDGREAVLRRLERRLVAAILLAAFGLGFVPAAVAILGGRPQRAEFLREKP